MKKVIPIIFGGIVRAVTSRAGKKIIRKVGNNVTEKNSILNIREAGESISTEVCIAYLVRIGITVGLIKLLDVLGIEVSKFFEYLSQLTEIIQ